MTVTYELLDHGASQGYLLFPDHWRPSLIDRGYIDIVFQDFRLNLYIKIQLKLIGSYKVTINNLGPKGFTAKDFNKIPGCEFKPSIDKALNRLRF